jgi:hypothetical protein
MCLFYLHTKSLETFEMHLYITSNVVVDFSTSKINNPHLLPILRLFRCYDCGQFLKVMLWGHRERGYFNERGLSKKLQEVKYQHHEKQRQGISIVNDSINLEYLQL